MMVDETKAFSIIESDYDIRLCFPVRVVVGNIRRFDHVFSLLKINIYTYKLHQLLYTR